MAYQRLTAEERRLRLLSAARKVFAEKGLAGASTRDIARAAGVSEGLLYRYFASKEELHAEVLRDIAREQDHSVAVIGDLPPTSHNLIEKIARYLRFCVSTAADRPSPEYYRFMLASFAGNGDYARLAFARAIRRSAPDVADAMSAARAAGDLSGEMNPQNANWFIEHVGIMLIFGHLPQHPVIRYAGDRETLLREALRFCARGIGYSDAALEAYWRVCGQAAGPGPAEPDSSTAIPGPTPKRRLRTSARS
jgi:TetR/AcrR family transcriptional regulator